MQYVLGFLFDKSQKYVLLIKKLRGPKFNIGRLNGIGGKCERNELPIDAMNRECEEETGLVAGLVDIDWKPFCELDTSGGIVHIFVASSNSIWDALQIEDEPIGIYPVGDLDISRISTNCRWLIPMSLNNLDNLDNAKGFLVKEYY